MKVNYVLVGCSLLLFFIGWLSHSLTQQQQVEDTTALRETQAGDDPISSQSDPDMDTETLQDELTQMQKRNAEYEIQVERLHSENTSLNEMIDSLKMKAVTLDNEQTVFDVVSRENMDQFLTFLKDKEALKEEEFAMLAAYLRKNPIVWAEIVDDYLDDAFVLDILLAVNRYSDYSIDPNAGFITYYGEPKSIDVFVNRMIDKLESNTLATPALIEFLMPYAEQPDSDMFKRLTFAQQRKLKNYAVRHLYGTVEIGELCSAILMHFKEYHTEAMDNSFRCIKKRMEDSDFSGRTMRLPFTVIYFHGTISEHKTLTMMMRPSDSAAHVWLWEFYRNVRGFSGSEKKEMQEFFPEFLLGREWEIHQYRVSFGIMAILFDTTIIRKEVIKYRTVLSNCFSQEGLDEILLQIGKKEEITRAEIVKIVDFNSIKK